MAAHAATYFESGPQLQPAHRGAQRTPLLPSKQRLRRGATLEVFFPKRIDNSRLVKAPDTVRIREMRIFTAAVTVLFFSHHVLRPAALQRYRDRLQRRGEEAAGLRRCASRTASCVSPRPQLCSRAASTRWLARWGLSSCSPIRWCALPIMLTRERLRWRRLLLPQACIDGLGPINLRGSQRDAFGVPA